MAVDPSEQESESGEAHDKSEHHERRSWKFLTAAIVLGVVTAGFGARAVTRFWSRSKAAPVR